jgi:hypothetical protein
MTSPHMAYSITHTDPDFASSKKSPHSAIPKIDIAVVGDRHVGKTTLIKFWLTLSPDTIVVSDTYSKIIWIDGEPIQLSIKEISNEQNRSWLSFRTDKKFKAVIYLYNLDDETSQDSIESWIMHMQDKLTPGAYQVVLGVTFDGSVDTSDEMFIGLRNLYSTRQIAFFASSLQPTEDLSRIIGAITGEAFAQTSRSIIANSGVYSEHDYSDHMYNVHNTYEMDDFDKDLVGTTQEPLLNYIQDTPRKKKKDSCCIIL